jgi:hypothetical protein
MFVLEHSNKEERTRLKKKEWGKERKKKRKREYDCEIRGGDVVKGK